MITRGELSPIGRINKTHGVRGELAVVLQPEVVDAIVDGALDCVVMDIDGIFVPFYITAARGRGAESALLTIDGIGSQEQAATYVGHDLYALRRQAEPLFEAADEHHDEEGTTADQLIGYQAVEIIDKDTERLLGTITDIDDSTANVLFVVDRADGQGQLLIPIADEFIAGMDPDQATLYFTLPTGLIE